MFCFRNELFNFDKDNYTGDAQILGRAFNIVLVSLCFGANFFVLPGSIRTFMVNSIPVYAVLKSKCF